MWTDENGNEVGPGLGAGCALVAGAIIVLGLVYGKLQDMEINTSIGGNLEGRRSGWQALSSGQDWCNGPLKCAGAPGTTVDGCDTGPLYYGGPDYTCNGNTGLWVSP